MNMFLLFGGWFLISLFCLVVFLIFNWKYKWVRQDQDEVELVLLFSFLFPFGIIFFLFISFDLLVNKCFPKEEKKL